MTVRDMYSLRLRIGGPSKIKEGEFIGLALDTRVSLLGAVVGGTIAAVIVWIVMRYQQPKPPEAIEERPHELLTKVAQNS